MKLVVPSFLGRARKSHVGIDVGTSAIKVVEAGPGREKPELLNYGELRMFSYLKRYHESPQSSVMRMPEQDVAERIRLLLETAGISNRRASMSIPLFSSFFTTLELPPMNKSEVAEAVTYEARQIVPVPLNEVILDWEVIGRVGKLDRGNVKEKLLVLLVAVPREVVDRHVRIAKLAGIELDALEVEVFSSVRAIASTDHRVMIVADIGARTTSLLLLEEGTIRMSHSLETGGSDFTAAIAHALRLDVARAETMKLEETMLNGSSPEIQQMLATVAGRMANEIERMATVYQRSFGKQVEILLLSGGSAMLRGLLAYLSGRFPFAVAQAQPFAQLDASQELGPVLDELGPPFAVAIGLALRDFVKSPTAA